MMTDSQWRKIRTSNHYVWETIRFLFEAYTYEASKTASRASWVSKITGETGIDANVQIYLNGLRWLAIRSVLLIAVLVGLSFVPGGIGNWFSLIAMVIGIFCLSVFFLTGGYAVAVLAVLGVPDNAAQKYVGLWKGIIIGEMVLALILMILPVGNNIGMIPVLLLACGLLAMFAPTPLRNKALFVSVVTIAAIALLLILIPRDVRKAVAGVSDRATTHTIEKLNCVGSEDSTCSKKPPQSIIAPVAPLAKRSQIGGCYQPDYNQSEGSIAVTAWAPPTWSRMVDIPARTIGKPEATDPGNVIVELYGHGGNLIGQVTLARFLNDSKTCVWTGVDKFRFISRNNEPQEVIVYFYEPDL
jgi:hypothetical protein